MKKRKYWIVNKETGCVEEFTPAESTVVAKEFSFLRNSLGIMKVVFNSREEAVNSAID